MSTYRDSVKGIAGEVAQRPTPGQTDDQKLPAGTKQPGQLLQAGPLVEMVKHRNCADDVERAFRQFNSQQVAKAIFDVVAVGARLGDARLVCFQSNDPRDNGAQPPCGLALPAADIKPNASTIGNGVDQPVEGVQVRVPPVMAHRTRSWQAHRLSASANVGPEQVVRTYVAALNAQLVVSEMDPALPRGPLEHRTQAPAPSRTGLLAGVPRRRTFV